MKFAIGFMAMLLTATGAEAAAQVSPSQLIESHLDALRRNDVEAVMADYADDAVIALPLKIIEGRAGIRAFFVDVIARSGGKPVGTIIRVWHEGDVGYVTWRNPGVEGSDEFLIKDGKIRLQAIYPSSPQP